MKTTAEKVEAAQGVESTNRKQKPSKTAVLTSIKTLRKNLKELGWLEEIENEKLDLLAVEMRVRQRIVDEL